MRIKSAITRHPPANPFVQQLSGMEGTSISTSHASPSHVVQQWAVILSEGAHSLIVSAEVEGPRYIQTSHNRSTISTHTPRARRPS